jgi:hypothetical protein
MWTTVVAIILLTRAKTTSHFTPSFPSGLLKPSFDRCERPSLKFIPVARCAVERGRQIRPLAIQSRLDAEIFIVVVSIQINHLMSPSEAILIVFLLRDRVAQVGRDKPVMIRVVHPKRGNQTAIMPRGPYGPAWVFSMHSTSRSVHLVSAIYVLKPFCNRPPGFSSTVVRPSILNSSAVVNLYRIMTSQSRLPSSQVD